MRRLIAVPLWVSSLVTMIAIAACIQREPPPVRAPVVVDRSSSAAPENPKQPTAGEDEQRARGGLQAKLEGSCAAEMYSDHVAGTLGLWSFEDKALGMIGFRDARGVVVISPMFRFAYEFSSRGITAGINSMGKPVFVDAKGHQLAFAYLFDNGPDYFVSGFARIVDKGKVGFINDQGRWAIMPSWDYAGSFCNGRAPVCNGCTRGTGDEADVWTGGGWGYIDESGQVVIPLDLEHAEMFSEGTALIKRRGGKHERIDVNGVRVEAR